MAKEPISKYVAGRRRLLGMTQKDLADRLSYTAQAISRFESVDSAFPLEFAQALCLALDCSLDDIYSRNEGSTSFAPLPFPIESIGSILKSRRVEAERSQDDIAAACGVTKRSLRNYENGRSYPSLQFLDRFCASIGLAPSKLSARKAEEPVVVAVAKKPFYQTKPFAFSVLAVLLIALLLPIPFAFQPSVSTSSSPSSLSLSEPGPASMSTSSLGKFGIPITPGVPNFMTVKAEKKTFSRLGESIELTFLDTFGETDVLLSEEDFVIQANSDSPTLSFHYEITGTNKATLTLDSAENGEGFICNIRHMYEWYYYCAEFVYRSGSPVYMAADTTKKFPVTVGRISSGLNSEVNVNLSDSRYLRFNKYLYYKAPGKMEEFVNFDDETRPEYGCFDAIYGNSTKGLVYQWPLSVYNDYIEIPIQTEADTVYVVGCFRALGNQGEYWCRMEPLTIHIIRE